MAAALVLAACGGGGGGGSDAASQTQQTTTGAAGCTQVAQPAAKKRSAPKPHDRLDPAKTYDVVVQTNCGSFTIRLAVSTSPDTAASFAALVRRNFFDGTVFHRIVPGFVIQGGDPTASGLGGPGYTVVERPPASARYTLGVVAMAKSASQPAGASGSQFFVVTAQDAQLPPDYAVLGKVVSGLPVVERIGRLGDPTTEQPTEVVEIRKATLHVH